MTTSVSAGRPQFSAPWTSRAVSASSNLSEKIREAQQKLNAGLGRTKPWYHKDRLEITRLKTQKWLFNNFLDFDFNTFPKYKQWGITFADPPKGALVLFAYGGLAGWRALRGWQRGKIKDENGKTIGRDVREVRDVLARDIYAITMYIWGLGFFSNQFIKLAHQKLGMSLSHGGELLTFSDIEANRTLHAVDDNGKIQYTSDTALRKLAANLLNEKDAQGLAKAARNNRFLGIPRAVYRLAKSNSVLMGTLNKMGEQIQNYRNGMDGLANAAERFLLKEENDYRNYLNQNGRDQAKAFKENQKSTRLERFVTANGTDLRSSQSILETLESTKKQVIEQGLGPGKQRLKRLMEKHWPEYSTYAARASKQARILWTDIPTFSTVFLLIGILPVQFNQWYTAKEYGVLKQQANKLRGFAYAMDHTNTPLSGRVFHNA